MLADLAAPLAVGELTDHKFASVESEADQLLAEWGKWTRNGLPHLGLPKRWVTERMREGGIGNSVPPTVLPDGPALTDRAVALLGTRHKSILRKVIGMKYEQGMIYETIAQELRWSRNEVRRTVARAQRAVHRIRLAL